MAAHLVNELRAAQVDVRFLRMEPLIDETFEDRLRACLPPADSASQRLVLVTLEANSMSHFTVLVDVLGAYEPASVLPIRIISVTEEMMRSAFRATPDDLSARNARLLKLLDRTMSFRVTTAGGTDLSISLDAERFDWISNRGTWRPGSFVILPAGEVATHPASISGTLVADGAINCNLDRTDDLRLGRHPITVEISDGTATWFTCDSERINELVGFQFSRPFGTRVGELGFGTNNGFADFVPGNSHLNERFPGVHIGFGSHNQPQHAAGYHTPFHMDMICNGATIHVSDTLSVELSDLEPDGTPHPDLIRDEDIVGDCCSIGYREARVVRPGRS